MKRTRPFAAAACALCLLLASCGSQRKAAGGEAAGTPAVQAAFSASSYVQTVCANAVAEKNLVARVRVQMQMGGKSIRTTGSLRMRKDNVIQLSLVDPLVGIAEVGRMEFSKTRVLIIDRINKQYVDVPYSEVPFLRRANIDFNTLQSLFWNEMFQPGRAAPAADAFAITGDHGAAPAPQGAVNLAYRDRMLRYTFFTTAPSGTLNRTSITSNSDSTAQFSFDYSDFDKFENKRFPRSMVMSFVMGRRQASLTFSLSSVRASSDWAARTKAPSKYTKADPERILHALVK